MAAIDKNLRGIVKNAVRGQDLRKEEIQFLLRLEDDESLDVVFRTARELRMKHFGNTVFLYGFLYASTYCRNDCHFCFYRRSNADSLRYRRDEDEIVSAARQLAASGVHLIDLTLGEDPEFFRTDDAGISRLEHLVRRVSQETGLPVMISPGVVPGESLGKLSEAGANWYACYQETHNRELFRRLRPDQDYDERWAIKSRASDFGLLVEDGILCGVRETTGDVADAILGMRQLEIAQMRAMTFVPQRGTPMASRPAPSTSRELLCIAVMRLACPDRLIPASLDIEGLTGLTPRLNAGANVVTSIVPPGHGLAGVAQSSFDISDSRRTTASVVAELGTLDLEPATIDEYRDWVAHRRGELGAPPLQERRVC